MDFYSRISKYYDFIFPLNKSQISFIESCIYNSSTNRNLLDIGCGTGGLPIGLYNHFDKITAVDINDEMLEIARVNAADKNIDFRNMGMLDIDNKFSVKTFDVVLCFGNTVVHLASLEEIELFFRKVKKILKQGGKFLFQIINYDYVLDNKLKGLPTIENDTIKFERNYSIDENSMIDFSTILTLKQTGETLKSAVKLIPVRKKQAEVALRKAGFSKVVSYSSFNKTEYNPASLPLVFECQ